MFPLTVKFLAALTCFTAVYLTTEAADTCPATTAPCLPGLPGRDGRDGQPGRDGAAGPPGPPGPPLTRDVLDYFGAECLGRHSFLPALSCKEVRQCNSTAPSRYYWIRSAEGVVRVYCVKQTTNCGDVTGRWTRAAYIDMTNESNTCPQGLNYTEVSSTRMCTRSHTGGGCSSIIFPTFGVPYTKVCGRARGYQYASPDRFMRSTPGFPDADGLIVTHGSPRNHIWSFVAGRSNDYNYAKNCPVPPLILVQLPLHLLEINISASLGTLEHGTASGTLMTLCGTHRGVEVGEIAVIAVVHGSLPH